MGRGSAGAIGSVSGSGGSFYGRETFQPWKILTQILAIHMFFYTTFAALLFVLNHTLGVASIYSLARTGPLILDQMLSHRALSLRRSPGLVAAVSFSVSFVLCGSFAFVAIVGRARRALDFATTMFIFHLVCCTLYGGIPTSIMWWLLNLACMAAMTVMCEMLSRRIELREIALAGREQDVEAGCGQEDEDVTRGIRAESKSRVGSVRCAGQASGDPVEFRQEWLFEGSS